MKIKHRPPILKFPIGTVGILLSGTDERRQDDLFHHADARLVAVNFAGDYEMATQVCDLDEDYNYDPERYAPLHSAFRVIKRPLGGPNSVAFNLGRSGMGDVKGGWFIDYPDDGDVGADARVVAHASRFIHGGPFAVGSTNDRHRLGEDADGNPINILHFWTGSLFRRTDREDGPLLFEGDRQPVMHAPFSVPVHLEWDGNDGYWKWRAESFWALTPTPQYPQYPSIPTPGGGDITHGGDITTGGGKGGDRPSVPTPGGRSREDIPTLQGGGIGGANAGIILPLGDGLDIPTPPAKNDMGGRVHEDRVRAYGFSSMEVGVPGLLIVPQQTKQSDKNKDKRNDPSPKSAAGALPLLGPVALRFEGFGAEGGSYGSSYGAAEAPATGDPWNYTERPGAGSRYPNGTGPGGVIILPPEIGMEDARNNFAPNGITRSTSYFGTGPNVYFFSGTVETANAEPKTGISWGMDETTGDVIFRSHTPSAATKIVNNFRISRVAQNPSWQSNTGFWGELDHAITADRTWTFPDLTMQVIGIDASYNVGLGNVGPDGQADAADGSGVVGIVDAVTVPTTNPTGGGILYSQAGALKWRGSSGTVTTIANA